MDEIEVVNRSLTVNSPLTSDDRKYNSQLHTETKQSVSPDPLDNDSLQDPSVNHTITRPHSVTLPTTKENVVPNRAPVKKSRSVPQKYSINSGLKHINQILINQWTHPDNTKSTSFSPSPIQTISISETETSLTENGVNLDECVSFSTVKGREQPTDIKKNKLLAMQNSSDPPFNKTPEVVSNETKSQTVSTCNTSEDINDTLNLDSEKTRRTESQNSLNYPELRMPNIHLDESEERPKAGATVVKSKEYEISHNHSLKSDENCQSIPDKEENKDEIEGDNENCYEDSNILDDMWMSYVERPLLPLKPLQKQRSLSCTNLVQTIKGFSKRKTSANNRFSSPENTIVQKKEICSSEVNIFNMFATNQPVESTDNYTRRLKDVDESFIAKDIYQSFEHHTWYHLVDAKEASKRLLNMHQNGAFLIRPASHPTSEILHTLCVVFSRRVYNFHVKNLKDGRITLGRRNNQNEIFSTLLDMIKYHQLVPISINASDQSECVHLLITPSK